MTGWRKRTIMDLAHEAHFNSKTWIDVYKDDITTGDVRGYLEAFADLVRADEREACAMVFEAEADTWTAWPQAGAAKRKGAAAIRARGQA